MKNRIDKRYIFFVVAIIFVIILDSTFFYKYSSNRNLDKDINKHYNSHVKVNKSTKLFNNNKKIVGSLSKGFMLSLDNITKRKDKYFKIKNTNYYVYYKDVVHYKNKIMINDSNYLVFNKNIKVNKNTILYKNGVEAIKLNKVIDIPINYMDDKYYYVKFLGQVLQVNKKNGSVYSNNNATEEEANYISVINNKKVYKDKNYCSDDFCISYDNLKKELDYFKSNGYYSISLDEYKNWLNGNIRLKKKVILLITLNEIDNSLLDDYNYTIENVSTNNEFRFIDADIKTDKNTKLDSINQYVVSDNTSLDDIKKMVDGEKVTNMSNFSDVQGVPVLNYHFFYDSSLGESCNEIICLDTNKFEEQLRYLHDNGYKTLSISEYRKWIYGEIDVPLKSVLITVDDGALGTSKINGNKLIPLLEKYKIHATLFLITAWWNKDNYQSSYLDIESHGDDIHIRGDCGREKIHCLDKNALINDLKTSINKLGSNIAFCFPFYTYNDLSLESLKEVGFSLGFVGGSSKSTRNSNKYLIPRYPIYYNISLSDFINIIN